MSLAVSLVALCSAALAVFLPAGASAKSAATGPCGTGVYAEYCPTYDGVTAARAGDLQAGTTLAPGVTVTYATPNGIVVDDHGTSFGVPAAAQLSVASDGTAFVNDNTTSKLTCYVILPAGQSADQFTFELPSGASFDGTKTKLAAIAKLFTVSTTSTISSLRVSPSAVKLTKVGFKVSSAGTARGKATIKTSKYERVAVFTLNLKKVKYTKAKAKAYKKAKDKNLKYHLLFKAKGGKSHTLSATYPY